ncbi:hypothetical protein HI914_05628 [Erysiphe necator]|nr:hypothetical protein HI914_05628 [Erysiphe necator]
MFCHTLQNSLSLASRAITPRSTGMIMKRFLAIPTAVRKADLVQDMYIRELRAYKVPSVKPSDSEGQVQKFSPPLPAISPEEANLMNELKAYEASSVEIEGQVEAGSSRGEDDWFESEPEDDENTKH